MSINVYPDHPVASHVYSPQINIRTLPNRGLEDYFPLKIHDFKSLCENLLEGETQ
jgi:hypothetical protein